jgi:hypothetical protein
MTSMTFSLANQSAFIMMDLGVGVDIKGFKRDTS